MIKDYFVQKNAKKRGEDIQIKFIMQKIKARVKKFKLLLYFLYNPLKIHKI